VRSGDRPGFSDVDGPPLSGRFDAVRMA